MHKSSHIVYFNFFFLFIKLLTSNLRCLLIQSLLVCKLESISNGPFRSREREKE